MLNIEFIGLFDSKTIRTVLESYCDILILLILLSKIFLTLNFNFVLMSNISLYLFLEFNS